MARSVRSGGGSHSASGGGGGQGAYLRAFLPVTGGNAYAVTVGQAGGGGEAKFSTGDFNSGSDAGNGGTSSLSLSGTPELTATGGGGRKSVDIIGCSEVARSLESAAPHRWRRLAS